MSLTVAGTTTVLASAHVKHLHQPCLLWGAAPHCEEGYNSQGKCSASRGKGGFDSVWHLSGAGACITDAYGGSTSKADWVSGCRCGCHRSLDPPQEPAAAHLVPSLLPSEARALVLGRQGILQREWSKLGLDLQGFFSSNMGPDTSANMVVLTTERRQSPGSHLVLALVSSSSAPLRLR